MSAEEWPYFHACPAVTNIYANGQIKLPDFTIFC